MTMAESAVEDAAAAPPGPAKPPPPSCTNNNTLAATANRNHRAPRKRRRLNQVLDDLNAHKSLPSEGETLPMKFDTTLASEEEEEAFGSPRSLSASENALQVYKRLKSEPLESTEEDPATSHLPYQSYYPHNHYQEIGSRHHAERGDYQGNKEIHHANSINPSAYNHRPPQKVRGCACPNCTNQPISMAAAAAMLLSSPTSPLTPLTPLTPFTPLCLTPLTPASPSSYSFEHYLHTKYLPTSELGRKWSHSDSDVPGWEPRPPSAVSSTVGTSRQTPPSSDPSSPQESPLDLSMKNLALVHNSIENNLNNNNSSSNSNNNNNLNNSSDNNSPVNVAKSSVMTMTSTTTTTAVACIKNETGEAKNNNNNNNNSSRNSRPNALQLLPSGHMTRGSVSVPVVRGDVASPTTKKNVAKQFNIKVSPVVEKMPPGTNVAYVCPVCGQMFSLHDRLAKHMASRHRRQGPRDAKAKVYRCEVCNRSFARSDMLTRHMRLHTGVKPYTCETCKQVFSRSDHLSTHQRTHTGEKPYKCPQCVYAACRRDMITRHLRIHAKSGDEQTANSESSGTNAEINPACGIDPTSSSLVKME